MAMLYSKTTNAFYSDTLNYANPPKDLVPITDAVHQQLLTDQSNGKKITSDDNGNPISVDVVLSSLQLWAIFQLQAKIALSLTDATMLRVTEAITLGLTTATADDVVTFVDYRRQLRTIISTPTGTPTSLPTKPPYPAGT